MKKLIVNADDFGYCAERNEGIAKLFEEEVITSSSFLINLEGQQHALSLLPRLRACSLDKKTLMLGLHLNFTEGKPISRKEDVPSLVNSEGFVGFVLVTSRLFFGKFGFREVVQKGEIDLTHIQTEAKAQIEWFRKNCGQVCNNFLNVLESYSRRWS